MAVAMAVLRRRERRGGEAAETVAGGGGRRMDSFIFPVDLAYISPPPLEADTKTNGLSSRSCKTSPSPPLVPTQW